MACQHPGHAKSVRRVEVSCPIPDLNADELAVLQEHASAQKYQRGSGTHMQSLKSHNSRGHWVEVLSKSMGREVGHSGIVVK